MIAEKMQLDKSNVSRRVRVAANGGYLRNLEDKRGKPGRWVTGDPLPESVALLPDPAQLATPCPRLTRSVAVLRRNQGKKAVNCSMPRPPTAESATASAATRYPPPRRPTPANASPAGTN